jgi:hypothetical protein
VYRPRRQLQKAAPRNFDAFFEPVYFEKQKKTVEIPAVRARFFTEFLKRAFLQFAASAGRFPLLHVAIKRLKQRGDYTMLSYTCPHCGTDYFDGASDCTAEDCPGNDPTRQKELPPDVSPETWTTLLEAARHVLEVIDTDGQPDEGDLYPLRAAIAKATA